METNDNVTTFADGGYGSHWSESHSDPNIFLFIQPLGTDFVSVLQIVKR